MVHSPTTLGYFCAPKGHYWEWEEEDRHQAAVWSENRQLIVFRDELHDLMDACVPTGLPPLGALLMVAAASSDAFTVGSMRARLVRAANLATGAVEVPPVPEVHDGAGVRSDKTTDAPAALEWFWRTVGPGLECIHALPVALRASGPARWRLVQTLFDGDLLSFAHHVPPSRARDMVDQFRLTPYLGVFQRNSPELNGLTRLLQDLNALQHAFAAVPPNSLQERLLTGLDHAPIRLLALPAPEPEPEATPVAPPPADLLIALDQEGGELAQVAGLVRRLGAILHVPQTVTRQEELPLGGVSDITNRGDPSRLLMTELAWDDLTFAVRLAQAEALYLRRESPPAQPPPRKLVLIDTGIFMWGKPRLLALGAALTLLRHRQTDQHAFSAAYALDVNGFRPITLDTVDSIRTHLTRLQPLPHAGSALERLASQDDSPLQADVEVFLITHPSAQEALGALPIWHTLAGRVPLFTLLIDRDGTLELARHSRVGARHLARARVEAEDLFQPLPGLRPTAASPLTSESGRLPAFYRQQPWPLYHPALPVPHQAFHLHNRGVIGVSSLGAVCMWKYLWHGNQGPLRLGRILLPTAPAREVAGLIQDSADENRCSLLFRMDDIAEVLILMVSITGEEEPVVLNLRGHADNLSDFRLQSGALVLNDRGVFKALSLRDGSLIASTHTTRLDSTPWFDGETFHPLGELGPPPGPKLTTPGTSHQWGTKRQRLNGVVRAGFGLTGGLFLQTQSGRTYRLLTHSNAGLEWKAVTDPQAGFKPLHPLELPDWPDAGLSQATFSDGRRIVLDPRGFLHVCGAGDPADELSLVMVKGHTAAWQRTGFLYGESNLLWEERLGAGTELLKTTAQLFRACDPPQSAPAH